MVMGQRVPEFQVCFRVKMTFIPDFPLELISNVGQ